MKTIKEEILSSFNFEDIGTNKTIKNILYEKEIHHNVKKNLYGLYEKEAEHLVRTSFLIKNNGNSYVLSKEDDGNYSLKKAEIIDKIMNFLNNF